ncbi:ATP-binding cassette domain-containing protein [Lacticaseibacillus casei]|jgi:ATP-binding cassette subfamily C protein|uniref:ATP-binding cassette domain-containing protein n=1 Tax=Lacticaseibacillus huelsenbergensis TaxID=3035291 RepID=A0ABY8DX57_9LACO|nr:MULTISPECIES: ATP-binding cassette domain-containing protein [Lacticaseibacillus]MDG3061044.1 ATP-binding cassette domain-containing protein [Lacticaseibacillus sp. BCRC 81376]QVI37185.1 ATP-binding cassette domain-containing protein [Lacticaseibacillus casei]QXG58977.1 ATP-binding cassette domain-containing protein [Lacticaseibacillus casei]WFB39578.1 ATP-binding cassette domain-containing protein [Lacticaseibacillus huelsenbergensis]WFB41278.1 ATP-binding cassette domain-containing protei
MLGLLKYGRDKLGAGVIEAIFDWLPTVLPVIIALELAANRAMEAIVVAGVVGIFWLLYITIYERHHRHDWAMSAKRELRDRYFEALYQRNDASAATGADNAVIQRDLGGLNNLDMFYSTLFPTSLQAMMTYLLLIALSIWYRSWLALLPLACVLLIGFAMMFLGKQMSAQNKTHLAGFLKMGGRFINDLRGMNTLVMYNAADHYGQKFADDSEYFRQATMNLLKTQLQVLFVINGFVYLTVFVGGFVTALQLIGGQLPAAGAFATWFTLAMMMVNARQLGYFVHVVKSNGPSLAAILGTIAKAKATPATVRITDNRPLKQIALDQVTIGYAPDKPLVTAIDATLEPGKLYGLAGENGTGKSTLIQAILGRLEPLSGTIMADNTAVTALSNAQKAAVFGYVTADEYLFSGTVQENLLLGNRVGDTWQQKLDDLGLMQFVPKLEKGYDTQVGEGGRLLSPGQRQQLAFARMLLADKTVYLLDEITSSIDKVNAAAILAAVKKLSQEKIVLFISHDLAAMAQADVVWFIHDHHLIVANHAQLYQDQPAYRRLVDNPETMQKEGAR